MVLPASAQEPRQIHLTFRENKTKQKKNRRLTFQGTISTLVSKQSVFIGKFCLFYSVWAFSRQFSWETIYRWCQYLQAFALFFISSLVSCPTSDTVFVLFPPCAIILMCFCICLLVSKFSCLLDCVFAARALSDLNAFVDCLPVPTPACLHMQLSSVSDLSCSVLYGCIWIF